MANSISPTKPIVFPQPSKPHEEPLPVDPEEPIVPEEDEEDADYDVTPDGELDESPPYEPPPPGEGP